MAIAAVTGLAAEARIARRAGIEAVATGGRAEETEKLVRWLLAKGATGLLSFGIGGGLDPKLKAGALVLATAVRWDGRDWPSDPGWRGRLAARLPGAALDRVAAAEAVVATAAAKKSLREASEACLVDLESGWVARLASEAGVPFAVLRAVGDPAGADIPPAALVGLARDASIAYGAVLRSLLGHPAQLGRLIGLALETRRALAALVGAGRALGQGFGAV
ncbi:MAG: nucleoside phosphorylase [Proteobacteria bacterium]|nr:nucleoside phosphorylase [Pseudomonadota bacterium]MBI3499077.1 nucleoside phosphorylase [Pseudomonadota bacterium]